MALVSNIVIDLAVQTSVLTVTKSSSNVEVITYNNPGKTLSFDSRDEILLTKAEFIDLCNQIQIFQTSILFNFNPDQFSIQPFLSVNAIETNNTSTWDFTFIVYSDPTLAEYSAILSDTTVDLLGRHGNKTIQFTEWIYFLYSLGHYKNSVKNYL